MLLHGEVTNLISSYEDQKTERNTIMKTISAKLFVLAATVVVGCGLFSQHASAVPITGNINFSGTAQFGDAAGNPVNSLAQARRVITFFDVFNNANRATVSGSPTGTFATGGVPPITAGQSATFASNYIFNPGSTPQPGLWSIGGFTFNLLTSTINTQTNFFLDISGTGILTGNGFTPTSGMWSFQSNKADGGTASTFSFAANTSAVPEGGSALALLGITLVSVEVLRRKLQSA